MAKQTLPQQHEMLHTTWPNNYCLCSHEARIAELETINADLLKACEAARLWLDHPFHEAVGRQVDAAILKAKAKGE